MGVGNKIILNRNGTNSSGSHGTTILVRHSCGGGNPSFLVIQDMDPRLRGGDEA